MNGERRRLRLGHKVLLICVFPLVFILSLSLALVWWLPSRILESETERIETYIYEMKSAELRAYLALAETAIQPAYENARHNPTAIQEVAEIISKLEYGEDGYFFAYDYTGLNVVHPRQPYRVGRNWIDLTDPDGREVIADLIEIAKDGGGEYHYLWEKPSTGETAYKIGAVVPLEDLNWLVGTGMYVDDVANQTAALRLAIEDAIRDSIFIIFITTAVLLVVSVIVTTSLNVREMLYADQKVRALNLRLLTSQEEERSRISRDLHDGVGQLIASARFGVDHARNLLARSSTSADPSVGVALQNVQKGLKEIMSAVRRASHDLRPLSLDELGLTAAIESHLEDFKLQTGIETSLDIEDNLPEPSETAATELYRVFLEALTNVGRHARARHVEVKLRRRGARIHLMIIDDGVGLEGDSNDTPGIGIQNMRERLEALDGRFRLTSTSRGTAVRAIVSL